MDDRIILDVIDDLFLPCKFHVDIFIRSVSRMRGQEGGYLEDIEGP